MEYVGQDHCQGRGQVVNERFSQDKERLDKQKERQERIETLAVQMGETLKGHKSKLQNHDTRLGALENRPGRLWDKLIGAAIGAVGARLVSGLENLVLKYQGRDKAGVLFVPGLIFDHLRP